MCVYIGIEDLAANALIEILQRKKIMETTFVSYNELQKYGAEVVSILLNKGEKAVLILSRENTDAMFNNYSEFFKESCVGEEIGICLKEGKTIEDLEDSFRGYLTLAVLLAFADEKSVSQLRV